MKQSMFHGRTVSLKDKFVYQLQVWLGLQALLGQAGTLSKQCWALQSMGMADWQSMETATA